MNIPKLVLKNITRRKGKVHLHTPRYNYRHSLVCDTPISRRGLKKEIKKQATELGANLVVTPKGWCAYEQISVLTGGAVARGYTL